MGPIEIGEILSILPHRYPFLLVDRVLEVEPNRRIVAIKNVTINEPFFQGHFPGQPIMPGVLIIEAMAQTGGILLLNSFQNPEEKLVLFMQINNAKFRKQVVPGDQMYMEIELTNKKSKVVMMSGKTYVNDVLVAEAEFMAAIADREKEN